MQFLTSWLKTFFCGKNTIDPRPKNHSVRYEFRCSLMEVAHISWRKIWSRINLYLPEAVRADLILFLSCYPTNLSSLVDSRFVRSYFFVLTTTGPIVILAPSSGQAFLHTTKSLRMNGRQLFTPHSLVTTNLVIETK